MKKSTLTFIAIVLTTMAISVNSYASDSHAGGAKKPKTSTQEGKSETEKAKRDSIAEKVGKEVEKEVGQKAGKEIGKGLGEELGKDAGKKVENQLKKLK